MTPPRHAKLPRALLALGTAALVLSASPAWSATPAQERSERYYLDAKQYLAKRDFNAAVIQLKNALQEDANNVAARKLLGKIYLDIGNGPSAEKEIKAAMRRGTEDQDLTVMLARAYLLLGKFRDTLDLVAGFEPDGGHKADSSLIRGQALLGLKRFAEASEAFRKADKLRPDDVRGKVGLAQALVSEGHPAKAEHEVDIAIQRDPNSSEALALKGELRRLARDLDGAIAQFDKALAVKKDNVLARLGRAAALIDLNRDDEASADIQEIFRRVPHHPLATYLSALIMSKKKDYVGAQSALQSVGQALSDHMPSVFLAGATHYALNELEQAVKELTRYVDAVPGNLRARKLLAAALIRQRQPRKAIEVLEAALPQAGDDAQLLTLLGGAYMQAGKYDKGTQYYSRAAELSPDAADIRTKLALGSLAMGKADNAIGELEKALDLDPNSQQAGILLTLVKLRRGDYDGALKAANELKKHAPDNPIASNLIGAAYLGKAELDKARKTFAETLEKHPNFHAARMNLARIDLRTGDTEGARKLYDEILRRDPKHAGAMMALAELAIRENKRDDVVEWLRKASEANPKDPEPQLRLIDFYSKRGEFRRALTTARALDQSVPNNQRVLEALGRAETSAGEAISAVATFRRLVDLTRGSPRVLGLLAGAQLAARDPDSARATLRKAIDTDMRYIPAYVALVEIELRQGNMPEAMQLATTVAKQFPNSPAGDLLIGDVNVRDRRFADAITAYEAGLKKSDTAVFAVRRYNARRRSGDVGRALSELQRWVDRHDNRTARNVLAAAYIAAGRNDEAIRESERLLKDDRDNPVLLNNLAWLYQQKKDDRAVAFAERALVRAPKSAAVMDTLAWILVERGEIKRGLKLLRQASALAPKQGDIRYHLAYALHRNGETLEARRTLEELLGTEGADFSKKADAESLLHELRGASRTLSEPARP